MRARLVLWIAVSACYRPATEAECTIACESDADCPGDFACGGDGRCRSRDANDCRDRPVDAMVFPDVVVGDGALVCFGGFTSRLQFRMPFCRSTFAAGFDVTSFNTDSCNTPGVVESVQQAVGPDVCVVYAYDITVSSATAQIKGSRPLVLLAVHDITISGGLSVASFRGGPPIIGAGADDASCANADGVPGPGGTGGGAAGGSFQGIGGDGGMSAIAGPKAAAPGLAEVSFIRGGCPGGDGGTGSANTIGHGGASGGAVYLLAHSRITISGVINANGAGADGCDRLQGGHGGGTGGYVGLEAPDIVIGMNAVVTALGGGGGAGGDGMNPGAPGSEPTGSAPAPGGSGAGGGSGGAGSKVTIPSFAGSGANATNGGGGGGGGAGGFIEMVSATLENSGIILPH